MKQHIAHLVKDRVKKFGTREVYRYKDKSENSYKSFSWIELDASMDNVSKSLIQMGFGYKSKIGIFSNNRLEWAITDYGILAIRGVVVPFFGTATKEQVKYIVDETKMKLMFVGDQEQLEKALWVMDQSETLKQVVIFDSSINSPDNRCIGWESFLKIGAIRDLNDLLESLSMESHPDDLATILYTSGTTGEPKGVMLDHDNFMYTFTIHQDRLDVTDKDVSMCFLPLSHVFERTWSYYILYCGAVNVFLENPKRVIEELPIAKPTLMCTVPRFFEKTHEGIIKEYDKWFGLKKKIFDWSLNVGHQCSKLRSQNSKITGILKTKQNIADKLVLRKLRSIFGGNMRTMPCSGAAIRKELLEFFHATGLFINYGYGATETTATVSCFKTDIYEFESVGSIMPGVDVKISDENEILVKGRTVFKGYYNKPAETLKVLKDGWYYTGDEGNISAAGNLVMTDRLRDLFKTSVGKYVSPQKIELLLGKDPFIEQILAIGDNRKYIAALIVPVVDSIKAHANMLGLEYDSTKHLLSMTEIMDFFKQRINKLQLELASHEKIVEFKLLSDPFTIENNAMTSTLKYRRKFIIEKYKDLIEQMY